MKITLVLIAWKARHDGTDLDLSHLQREVPSAARVQHALELTQLHGTQQRGLPEAILPGGARESSHEVPKKMLAVGARESIDSTEHPTHGGSEYGH